jgi:hypothetical protein
VEEVAGADKVVGVDGEVEGKDEKRGGGGGGGGGGGEEWIG